MKAPFGKLAKAKLVLCAAALMAAVVLAGGCGGGSDTHEAAARDDAVLYVMGSLPDELALPMTEAGITIVETDAAGIAQMPANASFFFTEDAILNVEPESA